jgi:hypothetical protein
MIDYHSIVFFSLTKIFNIMVTKEFKKVLCNDFKMGVDYLMPHNYSKKSKEWLIVRRFGGEGRFLTVSDTFSEGDCEKDKKPNDIKERLTMLCVLVDETDAKATFMMVRRNDYNLDIDGTYFPVDGYVILTLSNGKIHLQAGGRHIHDDNGEDIPYYANNMGRTWIFNAIEKG